jgi:hypothetical protein
MSESCRSLRRVVRARLKFSIWCSKIVIVPVLLSLSEVAWSNFALLSCSTNQLAALEYIKYLWVLYILTVRDENNISDVCHLPPIFDFLPYDLCPLDCLRVSNRMTYDENLSPSSRVSRLKSEIAKKSSRNLVKIQKVLPECASIYVVACFGPASASGSGYSRRGMLFTITSTVRPGIASMIAMVFVVVLQCGVKVRWKKLNSLELVRFCTCTNEGCDEVK